MTFLWRAYCGSTGSGYGMILFPEIYSGAIFNSILSSIFPESFLHLLYKFGSDIEYITNDRNREVFFQHIFGGGEIPLFSFFSPAFFNPLLTPFFYSDLNTFFFTRFSQLITQGQYFCFHLPHCHPFSLRVFFTFCTNSGVTSSISQMVETGKSFSHIFFVAVSLFSPLPSSLPSSRPFFTPI